MKETIYYWVDHTSSFESSTGVQRVTRSLARGLQEQGFSLSFVCWDPGRKALRPASQRELETLSKFHGPLVSPPVPPGEGFLQDCRGKWLLVPEVTHVTFQKKPPLEDLLRFAEKTGLRTAWIFYDAIPCTTPGYEAMRPAHEIYMRALHRVDRVLPISKSAGADLLSFWEREGLPGGKERVSPVLLPGELPTVPRASAAEPETGPIRFLCVGSVEKRKNHLRLLSAFHRFFLEFPEKEVRLTIVGNVGAEMRAALSRNIEEHKGIEFLGFVPEESLKDLYGASHATVFPSVSEGFGLPIVESLWRGKPCLCADFGAMGEVAAGGGCLQVDTYFSSQIFEGIRKLVFDTALRRKLAAEAAARPFKMWKDYALEIGRFLEGSRADAPLG
jgi:glycosyltransferase involved in cell wall biosynthesis